MRGAAPDQFGERGCARPNRSSFRDDYKLSYHRSAAAFREPAMTLPTGPRAAVLLVPCAVFPFGPSTKPFDLFEPARQKAR